MSQALPALGPASVLTQWSVQPLALAAAVLAAGWYVRSVRRLGSGWRPARSVAFLGGVALFAWTTCGFAQAYNRSLFSVWTAQTLALLLVVPIVIMAGQPLDLARRLGDEHGMASRMLRSRFARALGNPLLGPAAVLLLSVVLFFGPVPGWAIGVVPFGWLLQLVLVVIGAMIVLPLVGVDEDAGSLAVGMALVIGMVELILDAIPGIVLRLSSHTVTTFFAHRTVHDWSPRPLRDQQVAGAILWCVAELIDLPFLVLMFRRWLRADARDAAVVDTVLEAERLVRPGSGEGPAVDPPWWLTDPALRDRYRE
jgi:cytochrome c oxidase assembly factor CtaG